MDRRYPVPLSAPGHASNRQLRPPDLYSPRRSHTLFAMQRVMTRRLISIAFLLVGSFQVLIFALLTNLSGLWAAAPFILSIVMETFLFRCILAPTSPKIERATWLLTLITWSVYHLLLLVHWIQSTPWFTALAIVAWTGSLAMFVSCTKDRVSPT